MTERAEAIAVTDLHKRFGPLEVLKGVSLTAHEGDVIAIIGGSGSGKSTFLRCINMLELPSAGSTFKRPVGGYAAALIDQAGLKGYAVGGAQVSEKHAGFVVNRGGATFDDVLRLMDHIRSEVLRTSGVELEPEVKIIRG